MSVIQCFSLFLPSDKLTLKTDAPDGIERGGKKNEENYNYDVCWPCFMSFVY